MSENKKYYYMKLKENFFSSEQMVVLETMPDGIQYSNLLLKMYLRQHRTIRQADSARDLSSSQDLKSAGILYVFQAFQTAGLAEKIRRSAQTQLCGVA